MRKVSLLIGICMLVALALTVAGQQGADLQPIMKDVAATQNSMKMAFTGNDAAKVAEDAGKLQNLFTKAGGIFKALKAQDAVDTAAANVTAAGEVVKAAKANNLEAAKASAGTIQKSCKGCHDVHREALPDKTFKFK